MDKSKFEIGQNVVLARPQECNTPLKGLEGIIESKNERFSLSQQKRIVEYTVELNSFLGSPRVLQEHELDPLKMKFKNGQKIVVTTPLPEGDYEWLEGEEGVIKSGIERLQTVEFYCDPAYVVELFNYPHRVFVIRECDLAPLKKMRKAA